MNLVEELLDLAGARVTLIGIESPDEHRARASLRRAAILHAHEIEGGGDGVAWFWSCVGAWDQATDNDGNERIVRLGLPGWELPRADADGKIVWDEQCPWRDATLPDGQKAEGDVVAALLAGVEWARANPKLGGFIVVLDAHPFLAGPAFRRVLRDCADLLRATQVSIVLVSPTLDAGDGEGIPADLKNDLHLIQPGLPDRVELAAYVEAALATYDEDVPRTCSLDDIVDACRGGTSVQVQDWIARSVSATGAIDCTVIASYKAAATTANGLKHEQPADGIEHVGGLEKLKGWLDFHQRGLTEKARDFGMGLKGIVLIGPPGTGKSLVSRVVAGIFGVPLLSLSIGDLMNSKLGGSEAGIRRALDTAEALAPCVLRVDELEKALGGMGSGGENDGGTSERMLGMLLTWLEERTSSVFVVATANDVTGMKPESLRAGRWNRAFFVDLPHVGERQAILRIHLARRGLSLPDDAIARLAEACDGYSGSEIEEAISEGRWLCDRLLEGKPVTEEGVSEALAEVIPLSRSMGEKVKAIQDYCRDNAHAASIPPAGNNAAGTVQPVGRKVRRKAAS